MFLPKKMSLKNFTIGFFSICSNFDFIVKKNFKKRFFHAKRIDLKLNSNSIRFAV